MVPSSSGGLNCHGIGVEFLDESVKGNPVGFAIDWSKGWVWKLDHRVGSSASHGGWLLVGTCGGLVGANGKRSLVVDL